MTFVRWEESLPIQWFGLGAIAAGVLLIAIGDLADRWLARRHARLTAQPETPIDALSSMVACWRCSPSQAGDCGCTTDCGHTLCAGGWHTSLTTFTPEEVAYLRGERELPR